VVRAQAAHEELGVLFEAQLESIFGLFPQPTR
jgi:hypothetical protein